MQLRELIRNDYEIDLDISGGFGNSIAEPIVIETKSRFDASHIQMEIARLIYKRLKYYWTLENKELLESSSRLIERVQFKVKYPEGDSVITELRAFYFDISLVQVAPGKGTPTCGFGLGSSFGFGLPYEFGWLHYTDITRNEASYPGLGVTVKYEAPFVKASIYAYNNQLNYIDGSQDPNILKSELDKSASDLLQLHPTARLIKTVVDSNFYFKSFDIDTAYSVVMLTSLKNHFLKVRLTLNGSNEKFIFDCIMNSLGSIRDFANQ